jgi:hypothetical protein
MKKFTKLESSIIVSCLNNGWTSDMSDLQLAEEAGKNPLFTAEYIQQLYVDLILKVEEMTAKK